MPSYSPKSRLVSLILCLAGLIIPIAGMHRFYVGKVGTGVLMLLTFGGLGIWSIIDAIIIAVGSFKDAEGQTVFVWNEPGSVQ